mmetsp:Transcript_13813/g.33732  ORF Transcript_13813/g.33732 Transcript_13813/m.33732 type:complete len:152 (+) Transcript_13813:113-568(+)
MSSTQSPNYSGTWKLTSSENLDGFLKARGIGWAQRKLAASLSVTHIVEHVGDQFKITIKRGLLNPTSNVYIVGDQKGTKVKDLSGKENTFVVTSEKRESGEVLVFSGYSEDGKAIVQAIRMLCDEGKTLKIFVSKLIEPKAQMVSIFTKQE